MSEQERGTGRQGRHRSWALFRMRVPAVMLVSLLLTSAFPQAQSVYSDPVAVREAGEPEAVVSVVEDTGAAGTGDTAELAATFDRGLPLALLVVFLIGLALNLTPCVYPMLAVTVSIFGGQSERRSWRVFGKALLYVLGIATMYSILGVAAALTGGLFGGLLQSRAVLVGISLLFVALALSMFGLFELRLPAGMMNRLGGAQGAGLAGIFISGLLVGIFAAPCIGPPVIALLAFVGQRGDPFFGFLVFFVLSLGLGLPYLVLGTFSGLMQKMPRSGEWMNWVKKLLGFILFGVAFFYLSLAFRPALVFVLIPLTLVIGGVYLGFLERSPVPGHWFVWAKRVVGVAAVAAGILFFLAGRKPSLEWTPYSAERLAATDRPVVVYFSANWCIPCLELDRRTFTDAGVIRELNRFATFKVDLTHFDSPESREMRELFEIRGVPTMIFLDARGEEVRRARQVGFVPATEMLAVLAQVRQGMRGGVTGPAGSDDEEEGDPSRAVLVADVEWIEPGQPFRLGVLLLMEGKWHTYWQNAGDSGTPPEIDWQVPEGFEIVGPHWPHPQRFDDPPFATYGHEEELLLSWEVRPPADLEPGTTVGFASELFWLVCKDICIAQEGRVALQLEVRAAPPDPSGQWAEIFARADERIPVAAPDWAFALADADGGYLLTVTPPAGVSMETVMESEFFPVQTGFLRSGPYRWQSSGDGAQITLLRDGPVPEGAALHGVLVLPETAVAAQGLPRAILVEAVLPGMEQP